ncbi:MAG: DUF2975 domain-containing protein [Bacilli bacterium]|jgi:hypothetical protein|nr:DUF2975 domain-containing protein [Bacilli bacterium]
MFPKEIDKMGNILKIIVIIGIIFSIPTIILIPFLLSNNYSVFYSMLIVYPNGLLMIDIAIQFLRMFRSLEKNQPFTQDNVNILKKTGFLSFIMSGLWIIDLLIMMFIIKNTYINYIIVLLFLFILFLGVGIALWTLSLLFSQATKYKEENDLTI